ncbi:MAG: pantoate--beta-alanine ligase [Proteobacteria bacterium]|nr:pantoate--beta-alanine ligase [Pseudomonadota bacterium]
MRVITSITEVQVLIEKLRREGKIISLVPTMGYLHQGHVSLMKEGKRRGDVLVISIFVNPTQFGTGEDYDVYPRDLERDKKLAERAGVDIIFSPNALEIYPRAYQTYVQVEEVTKNLCGLSRPTHFRGVTTVVAKLFNIVKPHIAIFGEKDFQQLVTIRQMVRDLNYDIEIVGMPTHREEDGLAMSSRNAYLNPPERKAARSLYRSLLRASELFTSGEQQVEKIIGEVKKIIASEGIITVDYIKICDTENLQDLIVVDREAVLALAVKVGKARLIDNLVLKPLH